MAELILDSLGLGDEPMGVSRQALNGLQIASWGGVGTNNGTTFASGVANTVDLGVDTTAWRCWIAGFGGGFAAGVNGAFGAVYLVSGQTLARMPASDWFLEVIPPPGIAGTATVVCAASTFVNAGYANSSGPDPQNVLTSATANQWCGFTTLAPANSTAFSAILTNNVSPTNPTIVPGNPTWTLDVTGAADSFAIGSCAGSLTGNWFYGIAAPATGSSSFTLLENDNKTPLPSGTACFLTHVQGSFRSNSFTDGVFLTRSQAGVWTVSATNGKAGTVMCVR